MIDLDGKFAYSLVSQVSFDGSNGVVIYPNPASDYINIQTDNPGTIRMAKLSDWNGKTVLSIGHLPNDSRIDIKGMAPGIYVLTIFYQDGSKESYKVSIKVP